MDVTDVNTVVNAFCVDLEEYYHVNHTGAPRKRWLGLESRIVSNTHRLLSLMRMHKIRGTFFVVGRVAEEHPFLIQQIAKEGHEIACHSHNHEMLQEHNEKSLRLELEHSLEILRSLSLGQPVLGFRSPSWSLKRETLWALDTLIDLGFSYDSSVLPFKRFMFLKGIPSFPCVPYRLKNGLLEVPASVIKIRSAAVPFSLAGFFRLAPYTLTKALIGLFHQLNNAPVVMNIHPWDLDDAQLKLPISPWRNFWFHACRKKTWYKLNRLFLDYRFAPMRDVLAAYSRFPKS